MKRLKELTDLIRKGERSKTNSLLDKIYEESKCHAYCVALEKILLTEVAKALNDSVRGFYIDVESLRSSLFSENPPNRKTVLDSFRDILCDAGKEDREIAFEKALYYILMNLTDTQLSVSAAAEYSGVSESVLISIFREKEGKTVGDYIALERVRRSLSLLERGETVAKACLESGFSSTEAYIRAFKKHMGTTPGVWKRNNLFL